MKNFKIKALSVNDIESEQKYGPIWVINSTYTLPKDKQQQIVITVPSIGGRRDVTIIIPISWVPFNLTNFAPKEFILQSSEFRRAVSSARLLVLIDDKQAQEMLATPEAQQEVERLEEDNNFVRKELDAEDAARMKELNIPTGVDSQAMSASDARNSVLAQPLSKQQEMADRNGGQVGVQVLEAMELGVDNAEENSEAEILRTLKMLMPLKEPDFKYVLQRAGERKLEGIKTWAEKQLGALTL